jgi:hypothetical protein
MTTEMTAKALRVRLSEDPPSPEGMAVHDPGPAEEVPPGARNRLMAAPLRTLGKDSRETFAGKWCTAAQERHSVPFCSPAAPSWGLEQNTNAQRRSTERYREASIVSVVGVFVLLQKKGKTKEEMLVLYMNAEQSSYTHQRSRLYIFHSILTPNTSIGSSKRKRT